MDWRLYIKMFQYQVIQQIIKCWTDGVRHVPTVLVERVPVSKYVLVLLGS